MSGVRYYLTIQDAISEYLGRAVSWLCLVIIAVLIFEIISRYFFMRPSDWSHNLSTMLYGSLCILAGVYTLKHQAHVRIDIFYRALPKKWQAVVDLLSGMLVIVILGFFLKMSWDFAYQSWSSGEVSSKSTWRPPLYPFKAMLPVAISLMILQQIAECVRGILILLSDGKTQQV